MEIIVLERGIAQAKTKGEERLTMFLLIPSVSGKDSFGTGNTRRPVSVPFAVPTDALMLFGIIVTVVGVVLCILITTLLGYMLSQQGFPFVRAFDFYIMFTMLFNGGLVATYINYARVFHIKNTIWAYIIPGILCDAFYVMMTKNYFRSSIPEELLKAARIDGASEYRIFFRISFPLAKPIIATIGLMVGVMYWNDWQNGMYYIEDPSIYGIQNILNAINSNAKYLAQMGGNVRSIPTETARMAVAVVGILPILIIYPLFQEYFARGITVGAVKG